MGKNKNATLLGKKGGKASIKKLTRAQLIRQSTKGGLNRWKNKTAAQRKAIMAKVRAGRKVTNTK